MHLRLNSGMRVARVTLWLPTFAFLHHKHHDCKRTEADNKHNQSEYLIPIPVRVKCFAFAGIAPFFIRPYLIFWLLVESKVGTEAKVFQDKASLVLWLRICSKAFRNRELSLQQACKAIASRGDILKPANG